MINFNDIGLKLVEAKMATNSDVATDDFRWIIDSLRECGVEYHTSKSGFGLERWAWNIDDVNMSGRKWEWPWAILNGPQQGSVALDIGSGYRPFSFLLQEWYDVYCIDHSNDVVDTCIKNGMKAIAADITNIPLSEETADVVYCISVLEHLSDKEEIVAALREMGRLTKPGGHIVITMDVVDMIKSLFGDLIVSGDNLCEPVNGNEILGIILEKV